MQDRLAPPKRTILVFLGFAVQNSAFAETPLRGYQNQTTNYENKKACGQPFNPELGFKVGRKLVIFFWSFNHNSKSLGFVWDFSGVGLSSDVLTLSCSAV